MNRPIAYWLASAVFATLLLSKFNPQTGFTSLIRFGEKWEERRLSVLQPLTVFTVPASSGYDGQFYAQVAMDPLLRNSELPTALDAPSYRARRILAPATAAAAGLGNPWWTLQVYALLNACCWLALGWLLFRQLERSCSHAFARWTGCMFSLGVLDSVRQSLVDLPALFLLVLATTAYTKAQNTRSTLWLALSNLTKETSLLGNCALLADISLRPFPWRRTALALLTAALPIALWSLYVGQRFTAAPGSEGLGNFTWPLFSVCSLRPRTPCRSSCSGI
jgi:hypothetical protein